MKRLTVLSFLIFAFFLPLNAQVLKVSVQIEAQHLTADQLNELDGLDYKIEQYYNNFDWIDAEYDDEIETSVRIIIETVKDKTFEKIYKAQFVISSSGGENFYDKGMEFPYDRNMPLNHFKSQFEPLAHFLDFYAYMVLGGELDTYDLLLGTPVYEKAREIANQGVISEYGRGWPQKGDVLTEILHILTRPLREIKPDFFEALYLYDDGRYEKAYDLAKNVLEGLVKVHNARPQSRYLKNFFDSHYRELGILFAEHDEELQTLIDIDSRHRETYKSKLSSNYE